MSNSILAWQFNNGEQVFEDTAIKLEAGLVLETHEKPLTAKNGFHASLHALDALHWYSVRPQTHFVISRVRLGGEIIEGQPSSLGAKERIAQNITYLWLADAKPVLREFVAQQKLHPSKIHKSLVDLRLKIYKWIYPDYPYFDSLNDNQKLEKELVWIQLHPLENQVLEYTDLISRLEDELYRLQIWEKAQSEGFDLEAYLESKYDDYGVFDWVGNLDDENTIKHIDRENYERGRNWALKNPPQEYAKFFPAPQDPNDLFHDMLMQLAPEGYAA